MNSVAEREDTIVQEITIKGAAERIFAALLDPAETDGWWRTGKFSEVTHTETGAPVGGKWLMRVKGDCGPTGYSTVTGVYGKSILHMCWCSPGRGRRRTNRNDSTLGSQRRRTAWPTTSETH